MTKDELQKLGLDEPTAARVAEASAAELKGFIPKTRFDEVNTEKKALETAAQEHAAQLESLKSATADTEGLKAQIAQLQADNAATAESHAAELKTLRTNHAVDAALVAAKAKSTVAARAVMAGFLSGAEIAEDGSVKGLAEKVRELTESAETSFLFGEASQKPVGLDMSGGGTGGTPSLHDAIASKIQTT
jgi:glutamine synthetase adenylyltransferase